MKKLMITLFITLMSFPLVAANTGFHGKAEVGTSSQDVFRGELVEEGVGVINPNIRLSYNDFRFQMDNVVNLEETHVTRSYMTLRYELGLQNGLKLTPGVSYHHFWPDKFKDIKKGLFESSAEVSLGISYELYGETYNREHQFAVGLYSTHYLNVQADPGAYRGNLGIAMVSEYSKFGFGMSADVSWGWFVKDKEAGLKGQAGQILDDMPNMEIPHTLNAKAYVMFKLTELLYGKVHGGTSIAIHPDLRKALGNNAQIFHGGFKV